MQKAYSIGALIGLFGIGLIQCQPARTDTDSGFQAHTLPPLEEMKIKRSPSRIQAETAPAETAIVTAYTPHCQGCSGTTASGEDAALLLKRGERIVAASPQWKIGACVELQLDGKWIKHRVADRGGDIQARNRFDLLMKSHQEAIRFGRRKVAYRAAIC